MRPTYLCAGRVGDPHLAYVVPGSKRRICDDCGHDCWVSPSGQEYLGRHPLTPIKCIQCVAARREFQKGLDIIARVDSPTARDELAESEKWRAKRRS